MWGARVGRQVKPALSASSEVLPNPSASLILQAWAQVITSRQESWGPGAGGGWRGGWRGAEERVGSHGCFGFQTLPPHAAFPGEALTCHPRGNRAAPWRSNLKVMLCVGFLDESEEILLLVWVCLFEEIPLFLSPMLFPSLSTTEPFF